MIVLSGLMACTTPTPAPLPAPPARADLPNVVLVSMDTLRADRLGSAGYYRDTTPFLDEMATAGVRFSNSYAQSPATLPTHTSIFTGVFAQKHQVFGHNRMLEDSHTTLAEHLSAHGYQTYAAISSLRFLDKTNIMQGFATEKATWQQPKNERSDVVTDTFHTFAAEPSDQPFFAFLHYFDVHAPYNPPEPFLTRYQALSPELLDPQTTIAFLDDELRRLHAGTVPANGRPTIWIFTADHGEEFKEQGYLGHSIWMHEPILKVPLIVVWTGRLDGGVSSDVLVQSVDLFPTLLDLLDLPHPDTLQGRSMFGPMTGATEPLPQPYPGFTDVLPLYWSPRNWAVAATIDGQRFKLIQQADQDIVLTRPDTAPGRDVIMKHQPQAAALYMLAQELKMPVKGKRPRKSGHREADMDELDMLRSMGYLDEIEDAARDE